MQPLIVYLCTCYNVMADLLDLRHQRPWRHRRHFCFVQFADKGRCIMNDK